MSVSTATSPSSTDDFSDSALQLLDLLTEIGSTSRLQITVLLDAAELETQGFVAKTVRIGRSPDNDLAIDDVTFSRYHALVERRGPAQWVLTDLTSLNGLFADGKRVATWNINDGDEIAVGSYRLRFGVSSVSSDEAEQRSPEQVATALGMFNRTICLPPERHGTTRERSTKARAWLLRSPTEGLGPDAPLAISIARDVVTLGSAPDADVCLPGVPRFCAVIARGPCGFTLQDVAPRSGKVRLGGELVPGAATLRNAETVDLAGERFTFYLGAIPPGLLQQAPSKTPATDAPQRAQPKTQPFRSSAVQQSEASRRRLPPWARGVGLLAWLVTLVTVISYTLHELYQAF